MDKNLVYWHPDLFVPGNGVTYKSEFFVREYWEDKDFVESASYVDLSIWAIKFIMSKTKNNLPLVFLNRTDKFAQASSRLINTLGLKTHLSTNEERIECFHVFVIFSDVFIGFLVQIIKISRKYANCNDVFDVG